MFSNDSHFPFLDGCLQIFFLMCEIEFDVRDFFEPFILIKRSLTFQSFLFRHGIDKFQKKKKKIRTLI
jgi:hypothetical protein